jgi:hypothetical protein
MHKLSAGDLKSRRVMNVIVGGQGADGDGIMEKNESVE